MKVYRDSGFPTKSGVILVVKFYCMVSKVVTNYNPKCLHFWPTFPLYCCYSLHLFLPQLTGVFWMAWNLGFHTLHPRKVTPVKANRTRHWHVFQWSPKKRSKACKKKPYNKNAIQNSNHIQTIHWGISILTSSTIRIVHRFPNLASSARSSGSDALSVGRSRTSSGESAACWKSAALSKSTSGGPVRW